MRADDLRQAALHRKLISHCIAANVRYWPILLQKSVVQVVCGVPRFLGRAGTVVLRQAERVRDELGAQTPSLEALFEPAR